MLTGLYLSKRCKQTHFILENCEIVPKFHVLKVLSSRCVWERDTEFVFSLSPAVISSVW